jgi:hypothetical protein
MKIKINYHSIQSDHILAMPEFSHCEIVEAEGLNDPKLVNYITSQKDEYGSKFKKADKKTKSLLGFDYISRAGGVKIEKYKEPKTKKL